MFPRIFLCFILCIFARSVGHTQSEEKRILQEKLFPFISFIESEKSLSLAFSSDKISLKFKKDVSKGLLPLIDKCNGSAPCISELFLSLESGELQSMKLLMNKYNASANFKKWVEKMNKSGIYGEISLNIIDSSFLHLIRSKRKIIEAYGIGFPGLFPKTDSVSFNVNGKEYGKKVDSLARKVIIPNKKNSFLNPQINFAIGLLRINERFDAVKYEALQKAENKASLQKSKSLNFENFYYTAILCPGFGSDEETTNLTARGKERCAIAVSFLKSGQAPFIIVSGGFVHPYKTKYGEAVEMKKYIIEKFQISDSLIIIDPFARHTTSNIRNACRLAIQYHFPETKPIVIATTPDQEFYIISPFFETRCKKELGYVPFEKMERVESKSYFIPSKRSLKLNPLDPMDP